MVAVLILASDLTYGFFLQNLIAQIGVASKIIPTDSFNKNLIKEYEPEVLVLNDEWKFNDADMLALSDFIGNIPFLVISSQNYKINNRNIEILKRPLDPDSFVKTILKNYKVKLNEQVEGYSSFAPILLGNSMSIQELRKDITRVSKTDLTVLLLGQTGTGKGIVASSIHKNSKRHLNYLLEINCASIPTTLLESELFGYKRGAFTGAWKDKVGKFQLAENGTIFLDEISEMSSSMQAKLLQVLQEGKFTPLGGLESTQVNTRVLAATNADLRKLISQGRFREDLYYRLAVISLYLPPLKERKEDIVLLTIFFLEKYAFLYKQRVIKPSDKLLTVFEHYEWPGNVRELENTIRSLIVLEDEDIVIEKIKTKVRSDRLRLSTNGLANYAGKFPYNQNKQTHNKHNFLGNEEAGKNNRLSLKDISAKAAFQAEKDIIQRVLMETNGNKKLTAELLKVSYKCMLNKIKTYGL